MSAAVSRILPAPMFVAAGGPRLLLWVRLIGERVYSGLGQHFFFLIIRLSPRGIEEGNETEIEGGQGMRLGGTDGETGSITADEIGLPRSPTRRPRSCLFVLFLLPLPPSRPLICVHTCMGSILSACCFLHLNRLHSCLLIWAPYCRGIKSFA